MDRLYTAEWQNAIHESYFPILLNRGYWRGELIGKKKSGDLISVEVSLALLPSDRLDSDWLLCTCQDITVHKQAERAVKASEERLNLAVSAGRVGIFEHNHQDGTLYWSPILRSIYGVSPDESGSLERYLSLVHHTDRDRVLAAIYQAHNPTGDGEFHIEHKIVRPDGHIRHMSLHSRTYFTDEGTTRVPTRTTGTVLDITERKQAEAKINAAAVEIKGVLTAVNAVQATAEFNLDGTIITANDNFLRMMGYGLHEVQGQHHRMFCDLSDTNQSTYAAFWQKLVKGKFDAGVYQRIGKDGKQVWIQASYNPVFDAHGRVYKIVKFATDITDRKTGEARLEQYAQEVADQNVKLELVNEKALIATKAKSEFLATMSHEIRTPMNAIVAMADLLQETKLSRDQREYVDRLSRAAAGLLDLINNILDLSKIEAGHQELEAVPFDLHDLLDKTAELMAVRAHEKQLELVVFVHPDIPTFVTGDPTRLRQVLVNLVGNAIKFTDHGEVAIRLGPDPTQRGKILCSVSDTGIGISHNKLQTIFDCFTQVDSSTTRKYGGTGLGLSISKHLVEMMGGHIQVESQPAKGTTFSFVVPLIEASEQNAALPLPTINLEGRHILVVDGSKATRLMIREHLSRLGAALIECESGTAALLEIERAKRDSRVIDLAILDQRIPDMTGAVLAKAIRERPTCTALPLVILVSDTLKRPSASTCASGHARYIYKPLSRRRLLEVLATTLDKGSINSRQAGHEKVAATPLSPVPVRILLVEDLADNRDAISLYLKNMPYSIEVAENGYLAFDKFKSGTYDLIFMDIQMPVMDGLQATAAIRRWEWEHQRNPTPIIALTGNAFTEDIRKSQEAGCTAHLTKPIKKKVLLEAIHAYGATSEHAA